MNEIQIQVIRVLILIFIFLFIILILTGNIILFRRIRREIGNRTKNKKGEYTYKKHMKYDIFIIIDIKDFIRLSFPVRTRRGIKCRKNAAF